MWDEYSMLEQIGDNILVLTMRMFHERLSKEWLLKIKPVGE
jgi:hypothetical protein